MRVENVTIATNGNPGIVPPWLNPTTPTLWDPTNPIAPVDPDVPRIMATPTVWDPVNPIVPEPGDDAWIM